MNTIETSEYNKRCAEFLGYKKDKVHGRNVVRIPDKAWSEWSNRLQDYVEDDWYALCEPSFHPLKFHSDWNWIMEVLTKIKPLICESEFNYRFTDVLLNFNKGGVVEAIYSFLNSYYANKVS
ncbi:MAG TPA: hypothetical protein PKD16_01360 [Saprospiraceae bacterium]|jgi:hypothetical protein|nr:hypothetical protein [Saprospiraceae bacterium]